MKSINRAKINNVTVGVDEQDDLYAIMYLKREHGCIRLRFILTDQTDAQRLKRLMSYTGAHEIEDMNGKEVRTFEYCGFLYGFGDPTQDKFVPVCGEFNEVTEAQFSGLLNSLIEARIRMMEAMRTQ